MVIKTKTATSLSSRHVPGMSARSSRTRAVKLRDPERTRAAVLAAAVAEFASKGFDGARVDAIAERAGTNKRMLYHYFGDKEGLYLAVLESVYWKIRSAERALRLTDRDPEDAIRELVRFTWNYFLENPEFLGILGTENLHRARFLKRSTQIFELHSPLIAVIADVLARGAKAERFRSGVDPVQLYITIASLGFFYLSNRWTLSTIFRRDLTRPAELQTRGQHIVDVVLSFLRRR